MLRESFIRYLTTEKQVSSHTLSAYLRDLDKCAAFFATKKKDLFDTEQIQAIHHRELRAWLGAVKKEGLSSRSLGRHLSSVKTYFKFLRNSQYLEHNPAANLSLPRSTSQLPVFLKEAETERLFGADLFPASFTGKRDQSIMELLYGCGLRREELIQLTHEGVALRERQLKVVGKRSKERIIPFGKHVMEALETYLQ
ncbi:MAG: site-specific integrase, partial [Bacteroidota bacterium]